MPKLSADDLANQAETLGFSPLGTDLPPGEPTESGEGEIATQIASFRRRAEAIRAASQGKPWAVPAHPPPPDDTCPACGGTGYFAVDVTVGHPDFGKLVPCHHISHQKERADRLASLDEMTRRQKGVKLTVIIPYQERDESNLEALAGARQFLDRVAHHKENRETCTYFVYGPPGNGKTDILCAIVNEIEARTEVRGIYLSLHNLLDFIRDAWAEKSALDRNDEDAAVANMGKQARWLAVVNAPVIAIDEFDIDPDKMNLTGWVREQLWRFIYDRHQREEDGRGWTILSSNNAPTQFPAPLRSRLTHSRNIIVKNTAPDMRSMPL